MARNSRLNSEYAARGECAICGRGAEFLLRASAQRCLTFPYGVYITHRVFSQSCPLRHNGRDFQQVTISNVYRPRTRACRDASVLFVALLRGEFRWNIQYFTAGPTTFYLLQLLWIHRRFGRVGQLWCLSLNSVMFFSLQSQLLPRRERSSLAWESGLITNRLAEIRTTTSLKAEH